MGWGVCSKKRELRGESSSDGVEGGGGLVVDIV